MTTGGWVIPSIRGMENPHIGVEHASRATGPCQRHGQVGGDRRLAHPPLPLVIATTLVRDPGCPTLGADSGRTWLIMPVRAWSSITEKLTSTEETPSPARAVRTRASSWSSKG